jgi:hypothetical protein
MVPSLDLKAGELVMLFKLIDCSVNAPVSFLMASVSMSFYYLFPKF